MPRIPPEPEENRQSSTDVNAPLPSQLTDLGSNGISSISIRKRILAAIIISLGGIPFGYDLGALSDVGNDFIQAAIKTEWREACKRTMQEYPTVRR